MKLSYFFILIFLIACSVDEKEDDALPITRRAPFAVERESEVVGKFEEYLMSYGLVNVSKMDKRIHVDLKYATDDNFLGANVYGDLDVVFLQKEAADKLIFAQSILANYDSTLSLIVFDAVRPLFIQQKMWNIVQGTTQQRYVAAPYGGGMHNYGCAVDLSIVDSTGSLMDMGTPFDFFGDLAQPRYNYRFLATGALTQEQVDNRLLLRKIMREAGFKSIDSEWWHFNAFHKEYVRATYNIVP